MNIDFGEGIKRRPYEAVIPLINVVFLLLIFFLLAGAIQPSDPVDVDLPRGEVDDFTSAETVPLYLDADGFIWLDGRVMDASLAPIMLTAKFQEEGWKEVALRADAAAKAHDVIALMENLREFGVEEVTLVTERGE